MREVTLEKRFNFRDKVYVQNVPHYVVAIKVDPETLAVYYYVRCAEFGRLHSAHVEHMVRPDDWTPPVFGPDAPVYRSLKIRLFQALMTRQRNQKTIQACNTLISALAGEKYHKELGTQIVEYKQTLENREENLYDPILTAAYDLGAVGMVVKTHDDFPPIELSSECVTCANPNANYGTICSLCCTEDGIDLEITWA